jgi:6-phosphogluconolactonase
MTQPDVELVVRDDAEGAASAVADFLVQAAAARQQIALSGGSTPRRAYQLAAERRSDWSGAGLWWADERCVPPESDLSNFRLARETLLDHIEHAPEIHRVHGELAAEEAAAAYDSELRGVTLDLVVLGVGGDGHTASLFPHSPQLDETERLAVAASGPQAERVTLTRPALASAPVIVFFVTGSDKAGPVERAFASPPDRGTPASLVRSAAGRTLVVLDRAAAASLAM